MKLTVSTQLLRIIHLVTRSAIDKPRLNWCEKRGESSSRSWRIPNDEFASMDDISCFVIPVHQHMKALKTLTSTATTEKYGVDLSGFIDVNAQVFDVKCSDDEFSPGVDSRRNDVLIEFETSTALSDVIEENTA